MAKFLIGALNIEAKNYAKGLNELLKKGENLDRAQLLSYNCYLNSSMFKLNNYFVYNR